jgi:hypothetical protein
MSTAVDSANLLLKLYELRREETMRKARDFMITFDPRSVEAIQSVMMGPEGGYLRMVYSYWDMAAAFVVNGAIDAKMFDDVNGEHLVVFGKLEPFLPQLREMFQNPNYLKSLEHVCKTAPGGLERVAAIRERLRQGLAMRAAAAAKA